MIDRPEEYEKMDAAEHSLWWYRILHEQVLESIQKYFKSSSHLDILDAACGTGGLIHYLNSAGYSSVQGFDTSDLAVKKSEAKTGKHIRQLNLTDVSSVYKASSFDVVICNDALYFIEEKKLPYVINDLLLLLKPNGKLILNLPAGNWFKGMHDLSVGIEDRWSFGKFQKILKGSGVTIQETEHFYWPFLLSPLIFMIRIGQQLKLRLFPASKVSSDVSVPPFLMNELFYHLTKWERHLPFRRSFGSSLFIIIHKYRIQ